MITLSLKDNLAEVTRGLDRAARDQLPFATALALTRTARAVERDLQAELASVFDRPTPFVTRGTFISAATKATQSATVGMRERTRDGRAGPAMYVKESFSGGARDLKPFERALRRVGALPAGWRAIPGAGLKTDRYGNPERRALSEIIGGLASGMSVWAGRGKRAALTGYFVVLPGASGRGAHFKYPGIFRRVQRGPERAVQALFIFERDASYRKRLDFPALAARVARRQFAGHFEQAMAQALRSKR